jgi:hypothetical protein
MCFLSFFLFLALLMSSTITVN